MCGRGSISHAPLSTAGAISGPLRTTPEALKSPFVVVKGPNGREQLLWLFPALTLAGGTRQLVTNLTSEEAAHLGLDVAAWPTARRSGMEVGLRVAGRKGGWDFAHDAQFAAGRAWESTSTHAQIKRLTFREATQAEAQAMLDAQAALKPR